MACYTIVKQGGMLHEKQLNSNLPNMVIEIASYSSYRMHILCDGPARNMEQFLIIMALKERIEGRKRILEDIA